MSELSQAQVAQAVVAVERLSAPERVLADEIYLRQPNLLASVLVLARMGVSLQQLEVSIHLLLVAYQAIKASGLDWPLITEDVQERCLQRLNGGIRFDEGLSPELMRQAAQQRVDDHAQRYLLSFVHGYLRDRDLLAVRSDAEKYLLLAAFNLVECIAAATPRRHTSAPPCLSQASRAVTPPPSASGPEPTRQQRRRVTGYLRAIASSRDANGQQTVLRRLHGGLFVEGQDSQSQICIPLWNYSATALGWRWAHG